MSGDIFNTVAEKAGDRVVEKLKQTGWTLAPLTIEAIKVEIRAELRAANMACMIYARGEETKSLRDEFAMAALSGAMADSSSPLQRSFTPKIMTEACYSMADAMLATRKKTP